MLNTKKLRRDWVKNDNVYVGKLSGVDDWIKKLKEKYKKEKSNYSPRNYGRKK